MRSKRQAHGGTILHDSSRKLLMQFPVLAAMTGPEAKSAAEFKAVWDQFKATRENEIIPAVYAGKAADAKKIAAGVQAGRLSKMWGIMSCKTR